MKGSLLPCKISSQAWTNRRLFKLSQVHKFQNWQHSNTAKLFCSFEQQQSGSTKLFSGVSKGVMESTFWTADWLSSCPTGRRVCRPVLRRMACGGTGLTGRQACVRTCREQVPGWSPETENHLILNFPTQNYFMLNFPIQKHVIKLPKTKYISYQTSQHKYISY